MKTKPLTKKKKFRFLESTHVCRQPEMRKPLEQYLRQRLTPTEETAVVAHLGCCLSCALAVVNAQTLAAASRYHGIPIGPALVPFLEVVPLLDIGAGMRDPNVKAVLSGPLDQ
jgi:hypothetical protein